MENQTPPSIPTTQIKKSSNLAAIFLLIFLWPIGLIVMWVATNWSKKVKWAITGISGFIILIAAIISASASKTANSSDTQEPTRTPAQTNTQTPKPNVTSTRVPTLSVSEKTQVVAIITANTNHFKQLWSDGQTALGTTQYSNPYDGIAALNDPNSHASKFSAYKKSEDPVNDNSFIAAMNKADVYYSDDNLSDQPLHTWSDDMEQVSIDMGKWVDDATGWQTKDTSTAKLDSDEQTVEKDFSIVQQDIQAIK